MSRKFWLLICLSILIIGVTLFLNWYLLKDVKIENRGSYGDLFGFANTLFSGLAFVGVIAAILIQSEELKLQRDELKETRAEFKQQNDTLKKQAFENTYLQLVSYKNEIIKSTSKDFMTGEKSGHVLWDVCVEVYITKYTKDYDFRGKSQDKITSILQTDRPKFEILESYFEIFKPWIKQVATVTDFILTTSLLDN